MKNAVKYLIFGTLSCLIAASASGSVLCRDGAGHLAIEPSFHHHCRHDGQDHSTGEAEGPVRVTEADPCRPCDDTHLSNDLLSPEKVKSVCVSALWHAPATETVVVSEEFYKTCEHFAFFTPLKSIILRT